MALQHCKTLTYSKKALEFPGQNFTAKTLITTVITRELRNRLEIGEQI